MMTDERVFDGWRRLGPKVMVKVSTDDPAGLRQVREELDDLRHQFAWAVAQMSGAYCDKVSCGHVHYSHGEIARDLGVTRQAVSKLIKSAAR